MLHRTIGDNRKALPVRMHRAQSWGAPNFVCERLC
jgi:hypothetical protein